jgi:Na+/glutamate symporter
LISGSNNSVAAASNGLTSGASAGIGVGAGVGILLIGIGGILLWRRSRSKNKISPHELPTQQQELPKVYEPVSRPIYEVSGLQANAAELPD